MLKCCKYVAHPARICVIISSVVHRHSGQPGAGRERIIMALVGVTSLHPAPIEGAFLLLMWASVTLTLRFACQWLFTWTYFHTQHSFLNTRGWQGPFFNKVIMDIVQKKLTDIKPYEKNPRRNDSAVDPVASSIKEFGFKVPIVIDAQGVIVAGHTRYKAAQKLGLTEVPCVVADDLTSEQVKAFRLADNKVGELAEWDIDMLTSELDGIADIDMSDFGFGLSEETLSFDRAPDEFREYGEDIETKNKCPKCGYEW